MFVLVAAMLLLGLLLGTVAHIPPHQALLAASLIGGWLAVFAVRERLGRRTR
ncbi:MAG TPA: hypothetical protein VIS29_18605 [Streptomyces sp.]|jgi:hypothetical protein